jgi:hypothetical protein
MDSISIVRAEKPARKPEERKSDKSPEDDPESYHHSS